MANLVSENISSIARPNTTEPRDTYLNQLLQTARAAVPDALALPDLRARAEALLKEQTFPSTRQEDWRFTDVSPMLALPFAIAPSPTLTEADIAHLRLAESTGAQVVVVNGRFRADLSQLEGLPAGAIATSLATRPDLVASLGPHLAQSSGGHEVFTALNTASFQDAIVIWLPRHGVLETPLQILYLAQGQAGQAMMAHPRCLVVAEVGSALTLVEEYVGASPESYFTNAVTELWLEAGAQVNHSRIQREGAGTFHIGKTVVTQARDSQYVGTAIDVGARLARHHWEIYQTGEQTTTQLYGLGALTGTQQADTHSLVALSHPHGVVEQEHKCIVDGQAHSVFNGRIVVAQAAQLTNASQLNRNLLLSDRARVDTKPQLEIVADNVKCAHGATVSQLQADEIFYLQSRGISAAQAQRLLIYAFAMAILERLPVASLRSRLTQTITQWTLSS